jgi:hypothetical protein
MTAKAAVTNVVSLQAHPAWRSSHRRSEELMAAMRRHPSYRGAPIEPDGEHKNGVVLKLCAR